MTWPQATDYNAAVQNPRLCFRDEDLRQGEVIGDLLGLPRPHSGNFADVYQVRGPDGQSWAVKCFTRPVTGLRPRYQAISEHLRQTHRAFMVAFRYLDEGICVRGQWYPIVKMRWVEGFALNDFIGQQLDKPARMERLAQMWGRLAQELRDAQMAHGDLQHGNVLLVPGSKSSSLALKLIDYDGMFVPALAQMPSGEVGHPNYQHPRRLREGAYDREMDRFSHLLIYTALRCLRIGGAELWGRYNNQENLLFREEDFRHPGQSRLLRELWTWKDRDVHSLVGHLLLASQGPLAAVPALHELVEENIVRPLTGSEEYRIEALLAAAPATAAPSRATLAGTAPAKRGAATVEIRPATTAILENVTVQAAVRNAPARPVPPPLPPMPPPLSRPQPPLDSAGEEDPDAAAPLDPLVSLLSRPTFLAAVGAAAVVGILLVNLLVWSFASQPPPAPPPARTPHLLPIKDVLLKGGYKQEVPVAVERNECDEPLSIRLEGLPAEIKAPILTLAPDEETASLPLRAPLNFGLPPRDVFVSLWQSDRRIEEQRFRLSVDLVARPLLRQPESIRCKAGEVLIFTGPVERRNCRERLTLQFDGLPEGVGQESWPAEEEDMPRVKLTVAADARLPEPAPLSLTLHVGDVIADTKPLLLIAENALPAVRLKLDKLPEPLSLKTNAKEELPIRIERSDYKGRVDVRLDGLPAGVTASPAAIAPETSSGTITLQTTADAQPGRGIVKVIALVEGRKTDEKDLTLSVEKADNAAELKKEEAKAERVTFSTVDHAQLAGTLYPGSNGKNGACVLMIPDLGKESSAAGWRRLAEAIQAEGHTVLTFDFRGHGDSKRVAQDFWKYPINLSLPEYRKGKWVDGLPEKISGESLPAPYMPWLIHDIAAARAFLDLRHDNPDSPVNSFNLILLGVGHGAALGSLWLASEGYRFERTLDGDAFEYLDNRDVLQAVWLGIETKWKNHPFPVQSWAVRAHRPQQDSMVPVDFVFAATDVKANQVAHQLVKAGAGQLKPLLEAHASGWDLLEKDPAGEKQLHVLLKELLQAQQLRPWIPRQYKARRSSWCIPISEQGTLRFFWAKRRGESLLQPVPLEYFGLRMDGVKPRRPVTADTDE